MTADDRITLNYESSILPPILISIRKKGSDKPQEFKCRRLVRAVMRKHYDWEAEMNEASKAGDAAKVDELIYSHLAYMFEINEKDLDEFEYEEVHLAMNRLVFRIARRKLKTTQEFVETEVEAEEKKTTGPKRVPPKKRKS